MSVLIGRQPYPAIHGWENLSEYLLPGVTEFSAESVGAAGVGNLVYYSVRVRIDSDVLDPPNTAGMRLFMQGIPAHLRTVAGTPVAGYASGQLIPVIVDWGGRAGIPNASGLDPRDFTDIGFTLTTMRRQP